MNAKRDPPREAPESGRPAASDDPLTRSVTSVPGEEPGEDEENVDAETHPDEQLLEDLRELGWTGEPFVVHGTVVLGDTEMYDAAQRLGIAGAVPRIDLAEVYAEAGLDFGAVDEGYGPEDPAQELFEDWLRELPRHLRDKYNL